MASFAYHPEEYQSQVREMSASVNEPSENVKQQKRLGGVRSKKPKGEPKKKRWRELKPKDWLQKKRQEGLQKKKPPVSPLSKKLHDLPRKLHDLLLKSKQGLKNVQEQQNYKLQLKNKKEY
jgi:hypothetical protein